MGRPGEIHLELSVTYWMDPKLRAAGDEAELLWVRGLCVAKQTLSDGFIADAQLPLFLLPNVEERAARLVEAGAWRRVKGGYRIVNYLKRNKSRQQIEAKAAQKKLAAQKANHVRWHGEDRIEPDCPFCIRTGSEPDPPSETVGSTETLTQSETETLRRTPVLDEPWSPPKITDMERALGLDNVTSLKSRGRTA